MITKKFEFPCDTKLTLIYLGSLLEVVLKDPSLGGTLIVPRKAVDAVRSSTPYWVDEGIVVPSIRLRILKQSLRPLRRLLTELLIEIAAEDQNETCFHT